MTTFALDLTTNSIIPVIVAYDGTVSFVVTAGASHTHRICATFRQGDSGAMRSTPTVEVPAEAPRLRRRRQA